jgi:hypothetical protein
LIVQRLLATRRSGGIFLSMRGGFPRFPFVRVLALGALLLSWVHRMPAQDSNAVAGGDLFTNAAPHFIIITISPENIASLRKECR